MKKPRMKLSDLRRVIKEEMGLSRRSGHSIDSRYLISALRQRGYLAEQGEQEVPVDQQERGDSLDRQVDRYLMDYESNSKTGAEPADQLEWRDLVRSIVSEAPEDEEEPAPDAGGGEEGGGDAAPEGPPPAPPKLGVDDIDVEAFANDVARLVENYDSLLEVRRTLVRRAVNFIAKNYDEDVVHELEMSLRDAHGLLADKTKREHELDAFQPPSAGEAGPGGGGV